MANRETRHKEHRERSSELSDTLATLNKAAVLLERSATQMTQGLQTLQQMFAGLRAEAPAAVPSGVQINTWEDDPFSEETPTRDPPDAAPIQVALPSNTNTLLQIAVRGPRPVPAVYAPATAEFRYWTATEALTRAINFWAQWLPAGTRWTTQQAPMQVTLIAGQDLNANYSRQFGLRFYEATVRGRQFFSGESPDVACHELGHAILDALRPELFNAASTETAAFHESFGDMSAILSALQRDSLCDKVIRETGGRLNTSSRLSRLAEQLGWAIRQLSPTAVEPDCLRNAANRLFYGDPGQLPPSAPASQLASEPHSFSRVFTGAFLDALARMLDVAGPPTTASLRTVSGQLGQLLVDAAHLAPITPAYFSQVAAAMIQADQARFAGRYRSALASAFIQHGILAPDAAAGLAQAPVPEPVPEAAAAAAGVGAQSRLLTLGHESDGYLRTARDAPDLPIRLITAQSFSIEVHAAQDAPRFTVAPAAIGAGVVSARTAENEASEFVEDLIQLGRLELEADAEAVSADLMEPDGRAPSKRTHVLVKTAEGKVRLKRLHFNCCGCSRSSWR